MVAILKLLSGSAGIFWLLGALAVAAAAGGTGGYIARGVIDAPALATSQKETAEANTKTQTCIATHEKARADGAENAVTGLVAAASQVRDATADLDKKSASRDGATSRFLKELANVPKTSVCGASAAELAYRRSVYPQAANPAVPP